MYTRVVRPDADPYRVDSGHVHRGSRLTIQQVEQRPRPDALQAQYIRVLLQAPYQRAAWIDVKRNNKSSQSSRRVAVQEAAAAAIIITTTNTTTDNKWSQQLEAKLLGGGGGETYTHTGSTGRHFLLV